jgi:hypothetical protein
MERGKMVTSSFGIWNGRMAQNHALHAQFKYVLDQKTFIKVMTNVSPIIQEKWINCLAMSSTAYVEDAAYGLIKQERFIKA